MGKFGKHSHLLATTVTAGALAVTGTALVHAPPGSPTPRTVSAHIILVDHAVPLPDILTGSCAATDVMCALQANARMTASPFARIGEPTRVESPFDPLLARLLGAPSPGSTRG